MSLILLGILNSQAAATGGGVAYDLLETQVLSSSAASVTFTGLGSYSDYKHLQIRMVTRSDATNSFNDALHTRLRFNGDSGSNYAWHQLVGNGSLTTVTSSGQASISYASLNYTTAVASNDSNIYATNVIDILDFASTSKNKTIRSLVGAIGTVGYPYVSLASGAWFNTNAATSLSLTSSHGNYVAGSRFSLYGLR